MSKFLLSCLIVIMLSSCFVKSGEFDDWKKLSAQNQRNIFSVLEEVAQVTGKPIDTGRASSTMLRLEDEAQKKSGPDWGGIITKIVNTAINALLAQLGLGGLMGGGALGSGGLMAGAYFYSKKRKSDRIAHMVAEQDPETARNTVKSHGIKA